MCEALGPSGLRGVICTPKALTRAKAVESRVVRSGPLAVWLLCRTASAIDAAQLMAPRPDFLAARECA